jgi:hypothetical protein
VSGWHVGLSIVAGAAVCYVLAAPLILLALRAERRAQARNAEVTR